MKNIDFDKVGLTPALHTRLKEARSLVVEIESAIKKTEDRFSDCDLNWADFGSLTHAVEQLETAKDTLNAVCKHEPEPFYW